MNVTFASIVLNESEYLERNLRQHIGQCDRWIIVEGADRRYPAARVTEEGLSTDRTADIVRGFGDPKLEMVQHGLASNKCELRNRYAELIDDGVVIVFDADEFLTHEHLEQLIGMCKDLPGPGSVRIPHVHFWHGPEQIIIGGYWDVPHDRAYRWSEGCRYLANHNHPCLPAGRQLNLANYVRHDRSLVPAGPGSSGWLHSGPAWLHYGFTKSWDNTSDKTQYYLNRGEANSRPDTTRCRASWFEGEIPAGCKVLNWIGHVPEVMQ